jgi:2,3-bisphosphoglycerate-dependent phosphoglycerate mutase
MVSFGNIKTSILVLLTTTLLISCTERKEHKTAPFTNTSTFYLIRHAEKDRSDRSNKNPSLTIEGQKRSKKWALFFKDKRIDAVYSTHYKRTQETAAAIAKERTIKIILYTPEELISEKFIASNKGKNVVIVGHSNTTPALVNTLLGLSKYQDIADKDNNDLFIVTHKNNKTTAKREKVN